VTTTRRPATPAALKRRLLLFALAVIAGQHVGEAFKWLGELGHTGTRWADWIDLLVPYLVVAAGAATMAKAGADRFGWIGLLLGSVVYTQGHGIHLAGNSVNNDAGGAVAHLWDERVGHWIWYAGLSVLVAVLVRALPPLQLSFWAVVVAALAGFTWFDNTVEGAVPYLGIAVAVVLGGYAWRRRVLPIATAYAVALLLLIVWGIWQQGFPEFSRLGWI
jgi:hypothetical protein